MRIICQTVLTLLSAGVVANAQQPTLPPPLRGPLQYNSPYGPRNKVDTQQYQFHKGVDYGSNKSTGVPIYAVQGSTITKLDFEGVSSSGWVLKVNGGASDPYPGARFSYLHLFDNSFWGQANLPQDTGGNPILSTILDITTGQVITLEILKNGPSGCYAEVFWTNFFANLPNKALSDCPGLRVGGPSTGVVTRNQVVAGELIGVVGASGGAATGGPHLHLQVNEGNENALRYVMHDNSNPPGYSISLIAHQGTTATTLDQSKAALNDGQVLNPGTYGSGASGLVIRAEVGYSSAGHDLDQVQITMAKKGVAISPACASSSSTDIPTSVCFNYGGTGQSRTVAMGYEPLSTAISLQGLYPQANLGGVVDFLTPPLDLTGLDPGSYTIYVTAQDPFFDLLSQTPIGVTIPPRLTVTLQGAGSGHVDFSPSGLNSTSSCGEAVPICSDWFDIKNSVSLNAVADTGSKFQGWGGDCAAFGNATPIPVYTPSDTPKSMNCSADFVVSQPVTSNLFFDSSFHTPFFPLVNTGMFAGVVGTVIIGSSIEVSSLPSLTFTIQSTTPVHTVTVLPGGQVQTTTGTGYSGLMLNPPSTLQTPYGAAYLCTSVQAFPGAPGTQSCLGEITVNQ